MLLSANRPNPLFSVLLSSVLVLQAWAVAATTRHTLHVEWEFSPVNRQAITGFNLYQEGLLVCQSKDVQIAALDCTVLLEKETTVFTLTASFRDGSESPQSPPYEFRAPQPHQGSLPRHFTLQGFDTDYYLNEKLVLLKSDRATSAEWADKDVAYLRQILQQHKLTPESHYLTYGYREGLAPNRYFDAWEYAFAKSMEMMKKGGYATLSEALAAFYEAWPGDPYQHYLAYGDNEGINPSSHFDRESYLVAKLAALQADPETAGQWTGKRITDVEAALQAAGLTALGHFLMYGISEGLMATPVSQTLQPSPERLTATSANETLVAEVAEEGVASGDRASAVAHSLQLEAGEVQVTDQWLRVPLSRFFVDPIVVAAIAECQSSDPCTARLNNIDSAGFAVQLIEWQDEDNLPPAGIVHYLVLEKGVTILSDGTRIESGRFTGTAGCTSVFFNNPFPVKPVVVTSVASDRTSEQVYGGLKEVRTTNFIYHLEGVMANNVGEVSDTVQFIAWQPGMGDTDNILFEAATMPETVTDSWQTKMFYRSFQNIPFILADMQTSSGTLPLMLRMEHSSAYDLQMKVLQAPPRFEDRGDVVGSAGYLAIGSAIQSE